MQKAMPSASDNYQVPAVGNTSRLDPQSTHSSLSPQGQSQQSPANGKPPKQRRNKPTLSCTECVERKTKCDRLRPTCLACVRRQSVCRYSHASENVASSDSPEPPSKIRRAAGSVAQAPNQTPSTSTNTPSPQDSYHSPDSSDQPDSRAYRRNSAFDRDKHGHFDILRIGTQHPFHNYWTRAGGLPEVIGVLPNKEHADVLVSKYFETIDPLYPIISHSEFTAEYNTFWSLPFEEQCKFDAATLALHFVVYAMGTQYMHVLEVKKRIETAEFYISASHQALSLSSYLNKFNLSTLQTMVLTCYFLISNNHVSDAWTFSGIIQRQAATLELNRDPDIVAPDASFEERQQRCKLWQAIMFQDTGLALYLKLPPTSLHYDVRPHQLQYPNEFPAPDPSDHSDYRKIGSPPMSLQPASFNDIAYLRSMWEYTSFVQNNVCIPKSLNRPVSKDQETKSRLINEFHRMHQSWPFPFSSRDPGRYSVPDLRLARQLITISSNFFYVLMTLCAEEDESAGTVCDIFAALEAAQQGLSGFFALVAIFPGEVDVWLAYHNRAYVKATTIANILASQERPALAQSPEPRYAKAKEDLDRYLYVLSRARGTDDYEYLQQTRASTLSSIRNSITVI